MTLVAFPQANEAAPYFFTYINLVPDDGPVLTHLSEGVQKVRQLVESIPASWLIKPFAENEWTVQEILLHVMDTERIFSYRALRIARADKTPLPGFEQDAFAPHSRANTRTLASIFEEYQAIRASSIALFNSFDEEALNQIGTSSGNALSARAALYVIAGHELYHLKSIRDNYGSRTD